MGETEQVAVERLGLSIAELNRYGNDRLMKLRAIESTMLEAADRQKEDLETPGGPPFELVIRGRLESPSGLFSFLKSIDPFWFVVASSHLAYLLFTWITPGLSAPKKRSFALAALLCGYIGAMSAICLLPQWGPRLAGMLIVNVPVLMLIPGAFLLYAGEHLALRDTCKASIDATTQLMLEDLRKEIQDFADASKSVEKLSSSATEEELTEAGTDLMILSILHAGRSEAANYLRMSSRLGEHLTEQLSQLQKRVDWDSRLQELRADARLRYRQIGEHWNKHLDKTEEQVARDLNVSVKTVQRAMNALGGKETK